VRYSTLIHAPSTSRNIRLDRKVLADLAISDPQAFRKVVEQSGLIKPRPSSPSAGGGPPGPPASRLSRDRFVIHRGPR